MEAVKNKEQHWGICLDCKGEGKKKMRIRKKTQLNYKKALAKFEQENKIGTPPTPPKTTFSNCLHCKGTGLISTTCKPLPDTENLPHIAIIGGGIGGTALAVACLHRKIPFTLYERDTNFNTRSQGYGLTLQQASNALKGLGITSLIEGITSTKHVVHTTDGEIIGEWGIRKWGRLDTKTSPKRKNIHIPRQALRLALLEQLGKHNAVQWGHQFLNYTTTTDQEITLNFKVNNQLKSTKASLVVGADGIRSTVRKQLIGDAVTPLRYLDCMVILGICPLKNLQDIRSPLLDGATVFQTANGTERMYMMPYDADTIMWQFSYPMLEKDAIKLSLKGVKALQEAAVSRTPWHSPIPEIIAATDETKISGYPVYDRALLSSQLIAQNEKVTLIGDAAHPMSPFKGQGANQALLDALLLARRILKECQPKSNWRDVGLREKLLNTFESQMLLRSAAKVESSRTAAQLLHSETVLQKNDGPRGKHRTT